MSDGEHTRIPVLETEEEHASASVPAKRRNRKGILIILLLLLIAAGLTWFFYGRGREETDDAQIDGHLVPIASRVDGTIQSVTVDDNQPVRTGQVLVTLDPKDYQIARDQAKAQFDQASAQLGAATPNVPITEIANRSEASTGSAEVEAAEAAVSAAKQDLAAAVARLRESQAVNERAQANFQRYQTLFDRSEVARADYDSYKATAAAQVQTVAANQAGVDAAQHVIAQRQAQLAQQQSQLQQTKSSAPLRVAIRTADIKSQRASADAAQAAYAKTLQNLSYGIINSPVAGVVTQRSAEPGSRVSSGQQLMMVVETDDLWVTAAFKETQLAKMRPGQRVKVHVDALREDFDATVESMPAVTGARTSVLPPENATGNYVKVVQRMSVRIRFVSGQRDADKLRPGMSVEPTVYVE